MKYLLMCCMDEVHWARIPERERDEIMRAYAAWIDEIEAAGQHLATAQLGPSSSASAVRVKDGKPVVTDGPFADTKEQLGGYHLVECEDADEAIGMALRIPTLRVGGTIEVRPVLP